MKTIFDYRQNVKNRLNNLSEALKLKRFSKIHNCYQKLHKRIYQYINFTFKRHLKTAENATIVMAA